MRVVLHGHLRQFAPEQAKVVEVDGAGRSAREVLARLGVPADETAALVVGGEQHELDRLLREGETIEVIGAISGGARLTPPQRDRHVRSPGDSLP